jgi:hypothetical protein
MSTSKTYIQQHLHASLEEKIEILSHNPSRFYIYEDVWVPQGEERLKVLGELLQEAIAEEKYELCQKIVELKEVLLADPNVVLP